MKHIVLFKFEDKSNVQEARSLLKEVYEKLKNEHRVIVDYDFKANCLDNDSNMDIILFVELVSEAALPVYINHDEHKLFLERFKGLGLIAKSVIDI